jgi:hypothetical protein
MIETGDLEPSTAPAGGGHVEVNGPRSVLSTIQATLSKLSFSCANGPFVESQQRLSFAGSV